MQQVSGTFRDQISAKVIWSSGDKYFLIFFLKTLIKRSNINLQVPLRKLGLLHAAANG